MADEMQDVVLQGGSFDGERARALPAPHALTLVVEDGDDQWTETYVYMNGKTDTKSSLPLMVHLSGVRKPKG
jgi:hypothetical protein